MSPELETALAAAGAADALIRYYFKQQCTAEYKSDGSPVTEADRSAERIIRQIIAARHPNHGFYGEEYGRSHAERDHVWLIDPVDGTKSFVRGTPFFSVQIALMHRNELVLGVSHAPLFGQTAWAERNGGAYLNGERLAVATTENLGKATLSAGNLTSMAGEPDLWQRFALLISQVHRFRGYGDFAHYHMLAQGQLDVVIESDLNILDIAALTVILREAGAVARQLDGAPINLETRNMLACVPALESEARRILELD